MSSPGNEYYSKATAISRELKVNKANQTIVFETITLKFVSDQSFDLVASVDSGLEILFESSDENVAKVIGNTVTIMGAGTAVITASQEGDGFYHAADPVEQILHVNKKSQSIVFDALESKTIVDEGFGLTANASSGLNVVYNLLMKQ